MNATKFVSSKTGREMSCLVEQAEAEEFFSDPMTEASGCGGEFAEDLERKCVAHGCPACAEARMP